MRGEILGDLGDLVSIWVGGKRGVIARDRAALCQSLGWGLVRFRPGNLCQFCGTQNSFKNPNGLKPK